MTDPDLTDPIVHKVIWAAMGYMVMDIDCPLSPEEWIVATTVFSQLDRKQNQ